MRRLSLITVLFAACFQNSCAGTAGSSGSANPPGQPPPTISVSVSPNSANVRAGATQAFSANVTGSSNHTVTWQVNGVAGGNEATGTISSAGLFTAPSSVPSPNIVKVKAVSAADANASGTSDVTLLNPIPVLSSVSPPTLSVGAFSLTVNGRNFVSGARVLLAGAPLNTTFVSSTQLTASGTAQSAGTFGVSVSNPDPGSSTSGTVSVQVTGGSGQGGTCAGMVLGESASLNGFVPFPADNAWNQDISSAPVDPNSGAIINFIGPSVPVHPDFGSGLYQGSSMGIPYFVVGSQQNRVTVNFSAYGDESDPGPMPIPPDAPIEGYPNPGSGDRHVLVLDNDNCWLYELYAAVPGSGSSWNADSAAVWDLLGDEHRPLTWTSADAAGLPIFPGLARYDEVANGEIRHALRFTVQRSRAAFVLPASHWAANSTNAAAAPMGMRMRLKAGFDVSQFSAANQVILKALKKYGMIMADNGSNMFLSGAPDDRWNDDDLHLLGNVAASDFEVVLMNPIYTAANLPQGAAPAINSFTANPAAVTAGSPVTLSWDVAGASYFVVSPQVGAIRGNNVAVAPSQTITYTLAATNQFGRTTMDVTVTVH